MEPGGGQVPRPERAAAVSIEYAAGPRRRDGRWRTWVAFVLAVPIGLVACPGIIGGPHNAFHDIGGVVSVCWLVGAVAVLFGVCLLAARHRFKVGVVFSAAAAAGNIAELSHDYARLGVPFGIAEQGKTFAIVFAIFSLVAAFFAAVLAPPHDPG